jgi:hypothetical protein
MEILNFNLENFLTKKCFIPLKNYVLTSVGSICNLAQSGVRNLAQSCVIFRNLVPSYDFLRVQKFGRKIVIFRKYKSNK